MKRGRRSLSRGAPFRGRITKPSPFVMSGIVSFVFSLATAVPAGAQSAGPGAAPDGQHVFMEARCYVCHGQMGVGGAGPSLSADPYLALSDYVVAKVLLGRDIMPSFADSLSDQQIAAVASYIRNSWGNRYGDVAPQEAAQVRSEVGPRQAPSAQGRSGQPPSGQAPSGSSQPH